MGRIFGVKIKSSKTSSIITKKDIENYTNGIDSVSPGVIMMHSGDTIPAAWLLCDGGEYSSTQYDSLYAVIGNTYDSHPTLGAPAVGKFRVPDMRDLFPVAQNPSGPVAANSLGKYNITTFQHTHVLPEHSHVLASHTHSFPSSHTHGMPTHTHTLNNHYHTIPSHQHTVPAHGHVFPNHAHSHNLTVNHTHYHDIQADTTGTTADVDYNCPRGGATVSAGNLNTVSTSSVTLFFRSASGTVGAGSLNLSTTTGYLNNNAAFASGASTGWISTNNDTTGSASSTISGAPTGTGTGGNTGAPSTNTTNIDGQSTTGVGSPPYFGFYFIIKT